MNTPILYIGGAARSGSTLLESMLASLPGCVSVGEAVFLWERGVERNDRCACGERFLECPFWVKVGDVAFGGWDRAPATEAQRLRRAVDRHRNLHRLGPFRPGPLQGDLESYAAITATVYEAVVSVSGASVIVDSSKHVAYAAVLSGLPRADLRLVHLVRRPEAVAFSWARQVRKPAVGDGTGYMSRHSTPWVLRQWTADNLLFDVMSTRRPSALLRYEDFVRRPVHELARVLRALGFERLARGAAELDACAVPVPSIHAISGNPKRAADGVLEFRIDEEWRTSMPIGRRAAVTAVTWPLLARYGYLSRAGERV